MDTRNLLTPELSDYFPFADLPEWLNEEALAMGINFSQVLQEALLSKIQAR